MIEAILFDTALFDTALFDTANRHRSQQHRPQLTLVDRRQRDVEAASGDADRDHVVVRVRLIRNAVVLTFERGHHRG